MPPLPPTVVGPYWVDDEYKDDHPVLNRSELATVRVTLQEEDLTMLLTPINAFNQTYVKAHVVFTNNHVHFALDDAGFRLHGFSTRLSCKKSWSLSFDKFKKGRRMYGLPGIKLNGERTDPTMVRETVSMDAYRAMNIPAPRGSYAEVYVNDVYSGLYIMIEDVDKAFLDGRVGENKGQLYKCRSGAPLDYRGPDPKTYENMVSSYLNQTWHLYELDSKPQPGDYYDIVTLVTAINASSTQTFIEKVSAVFDMDLYVRSMVLEVALAQVDGYAYNGNNYRLYHARDKMLWLPFDFDVSQGSCVNFPPGDPWSRDWAHQNVYSWGSFSDQSICGGLRPLMVRMINTPFFRNMFTSYFHKLLSRSLGINPDLAPRGCTQGALGKYDDSPLYQRIFAMKALIEGAHARDTWLMLDNWWQKEDFELGFCHPVSRYVPKDKTSVPIIRWGLVEFFRERVRSAKQQLDP